MPRRFFGNSEFAHSFVLASGVLVLVVSILFLPIALGIHQEVDPRCEMPACRMIVVSAPDPLYMPLNLAGMAVGVTLIVLARFVGKPALRDYGWPGD